MTPSLDFVPKDPVTGHGKLVQIAATATPGTSLYTAVSSTDDEWDVVFVAASNNDTADHLLTVEWTAAGSANEVKVLLPGRSGMWTIIPALRIRNALTVKAYADAANQVNAYIDVDRLIGSLD